MGLQPVKFKQMGGWRREHFSKVSYFLYVPLMTQSPITYFNFKYGTIR